MSKQNSKPSWTFKFRWSLNRLRIATARPLDRATCRSAVMVQDRALTPLFLTIAIIVPRSRCCCHGYKEETAGCNEWCRFLTGRDYPEGKQLRLLFGDGRHQNDGRACSFLSRATVLPVLFIGLLSCFRHHGHPARELMRGGRDSDTVFGSDKCGVKQHPGNTNTQSALLCLICCGWSVGHRVTLTLGPSG